MKHENSDLSPEIFDLLEQKNFSELSKYECELVLKFISEKEYTEMKNTLNYVKNNLSIDKSFEKLTPSPFPVLTNESKTNSVNGTSILSILISLIKKPVPIYSLILALFIFVIYSILFNNSTNNVVTERFITIKDTVRVLIPLTNIKNDPLKVFAKSNFSTLSQKNPDVVEASSIKEDIALSENNRLLLDKNIQLALSSKTGKSIESDSSLLKYLFSTQ